MNKKRKKKLVTSSILLVLLVGFLGLTIGFSGISNVKGDGISGNNTSSNGKIPICDRSVAKNCWGNDIMGVRIAIVDKDGGLVAGPADFWAKSTSTKKTFSYGMQIRQNASSSMTSGNYWGSGKVYVADATLKELGLTSVGTSGNTVMEKIKSLSKTDMDKTFKVLESLFSKLGYDGSETSIRDAAAKEYFIQFEPLVAGDHYGSSVNDYFFAMSVTEFALADPGISGDGGAYAKGVKTMGTKYMNLGIKPGEKRPTCFDDSATGGYTGAINLKSGTGVAHLWLPDLIGGGECEDAIEYINKTYTAGSTEYNKAVEQVKNGNFEYTKDGGKYRIDTPQKYDFLEESNYSKADKYDNKARCENYKITDCPTAVKYINSWGTGKTPGLNTSEYHADIKEVREGTFIYWATDMTKDPKTGEYNYYYFKVERAYPEYTGLDPAVYGSSEAWCGLGDITELSCDEALSYIHAHSSEYGTPGSTKYNDTIASVRNGTFSYVDETDPANKKTYKVPSTGFTGTQYAMLLPANYGNGQASCKPKPPTCGKDALIRVDPCESGFNYYKDSSLEEDWLKCETAYFNGGTKYTSDNTGHIAVETTNGGIVGNSEYCKLFCYEEVETNFPAKVMDVKAGQTFGWGQSGYGSSNKFGTVKVHKHCSNKKRTDAEGLSGDGYLYKKWENDYKANEKAIIEGHIRAGAAQEAQDHIRVTTSRCCLPSDYYWYCPRRGSCYQRCNPTGTIAYASSSQAHTNPSDGSINGNWPGATTQGASASASSGCQPSYSYAYQSAYNSVKGQLQSQESSALSQSSSAKTNEPKLLEKIRQCTNNIKYVYKTVVTFSFDEPTNHEYGPNDRMFSNHDELEVKPLIGAEGYNENNVNKSTCTTKTVYTYSCSGSKLSAKCTASPTQVLDCKQVTWDIKGEWEYNYPAGEFEWYSLKTNNKLMNGTNKTGEGDEFFYSLGFGLPTAFTLTSGEYDMAVIVTNLGDHGEITDAPGADYNVANGHFGPVATTYPEGKGFKYECTYEVDNDVFGYDCVYENGRLTSNSPKYCDNSKDDDSNGELVGIDVAYRLVSLLNAGDDINKAFPGQDGSGRRMGSNWSEVAGEISDILRADVYQQDRNGRPNLAMYEIFLDVRKIQEIRQDSKNFAGSGDPYTSFENIKCAGDNQKYCASDFISELASTGPDATRLYGTCITDIDTQTRANNVLANGCNGTYTFPTINWVR